MAIELVPDSGHFIAEEKPELVAARAREFLGRPPLRSVSAGTAA